MNYVTGAGLLAVAGGLGFMAYCMTLTGLWFNRQEDPPTLRQNLYGTALIVGCWGACVLVGGVAIFVVGR